MDKPCKRPDLRGWSVRGGYWQIWKDGKSQYQHRVALEEKLGRPIRPDYCACPTCDNPWCREPEHLFEATHIENVWDSVSKGRHRLKETYCRRGHLLTKENSAPNTRGRCCRICRDTRMRGWRRKKAEIGG